MPTARLTDADAAVRSRPKSSAPARSSPSPALAKVSNTKSPSQVSTSAMPDVKSAGRSITSGAGTSFGPTAAKASSPTSDAVSKPSPNSTPTTYIFHWESTDASTGRQHLAKHPPCTWPPEPWPWGSASPRAAARHSRNWGPMDARFTTPSVDSMTALNAAETVAPAVVNAPTLSRTYAEPPATTPQSPTTMVLWPRLNQSPTSAAGRPRPARRRATLSMAAMWSQSTPWRSPKPSASRPGDTSAG